MSVFSRSCSRLPFDLSLYLVANRPSFQNEDLFFWRIREAVRGGVSCVQLRDHESDFAKTLKTAARLKDFLKGTPLFINTHESLEVANAVGAEGIYLEEPFPHAEVRKLLGQKVIIGIPVKTMDEVLAAGQSNAVDYLSVKIFRSKRTCPRNDALWGVEGLRIIRALSPHRIVVIGGLNLEHAELIYRELHRGDGIAMAGGLMRENDPYTTAREILSARDKS